MTIEIHVAIFVAIILGCMGVMIISYNILENNRELEKHHKETTERFRFLGKLIELQKSVLEREEKALTICTNPNSWLLTRKEGKNTALYHDLDKEERVSRHIVFAIPKDGMTTISFFIGLFSNSFTEWPARYRSTLIRAKYSFLHKNPEYQKDIDRDYESFLDWFNKEKQLEWEEEVIYKAFDKL